MSEQIKTPCHYRLNDPGRFNFATYYDADDAPIEPRLIIKALDTHARLTSENTELAKNVSELKAKVEAANQMLEQAVSVQFENGWVAPTVAGQPPMKVWEFGEGDIAETGEYPTFWEAFNALRGEE